MLVIIRGLPGSGKTTLARMFVEQGYHHVEKDLKRVNARTGIYEYDKLKNPVLEELCINEVENFINAGRDVVVSNCNELIAFVQRYIEIAEDLGVQWTVIETKGNLGSRYGTDEEVGRPRRVKAWEHFPVN